MRLTIERMRLLVLLAGGALVLALAGFLLLSHLRSRFNLRDLPKRLGVDIQMEENGFTLTRALGGHTEFKMHAAKMVRLKQGGRALLNDVDIELYGKNGETVDRIQGGQFAWDPGTKKAVAAGPVEILIMRPMATAAVAEGMRGTVPAKPKTPATALSAPAKAAAQSVEKGQIDVKTSGLTFDSDTGTATTAERVEFATVEGSGSAKGAEFNSDAGTLVLEHAVDLTARRGNENVAIRAEHAEFDRGELTCDLRQAAADYRGGQATAGRAQILFRQDGSAVRLDAEDGFQMTTATGAKIGAPTGSIEFNQQNQPQQGRLEGGVTMASLGGGRSVTGSAPTADLKFSPKGDLQQAHLERGVKLHSEQGGAGGVQVARDWSSPVTDVAFHSANGRTEIEQVHGTGGVVITGLTQRAGGGAAPSRMTAEDVTGNLGSGQVIEEMTGVGHASLEEGTATGVHQATTGDRIVVQFAPAAGPQRGSESADQIRSAVVDGNVIMTQQEPAKGERAATSLRATSGHALYEGSGEWLHLTLNPRVEENGLVVTAETVDVLQASGDAFAHGNVKATWTGDGKQGASGKVATPGAVGLGGNGPAHVIAAEAEMQRATDEAKFKGDARLWQGANSVSAPVIVLNRARQTLVAQGSSDAPAVNLVLLSAARPTGKKNVSGTAGPEVVRVTAGGLTYSAETRRAELSGDGGKGVVAQAEGATVRSNEAELTLVPADDRGGRGGRSGTESGAGQVESMTAKGHVVVTSEGRRGTGDKLVYTSASGQYVLTGTSEAPPKLIDVVRGTVSGNALIFNSRDDSVSIEGGGKKTQTETVAPK